MKIAHLLEQRKVLNKESLDFVWELLVVVALAAMLLWVVGGSRERYLFLDDGIALLLHSLDYNVGQLLNPEVVIHLKLILYDVVATVKVGNDIRVENFVARQFQKV